MTEDEAKAKWCPFGRIAHVNGATANSRAHNDPDLAQDCAGSACMAWRWHDNDLLTIADQLASAKRELAMRRRFYPRWVQADKMSSTTASHEIACMEAIIATLEGLAPPEPKQGALL